jgi:hypothetical protein
MQISHHPFASWHAAALIGASRIDAITWRRRRGG